MKEYTKITGGIIALSAMVACSSNPVQKSEIRKPNIIILLAADAGYADFGFMEIKNKLKAISHEKFTI